MHIKIAQINIKHHNYAEEIATSTTLATCFWKNHHFYNSSTAQINVQNIKR